MRCSGVLPVIQTLLSEIYPTDIRAQSIGITQSSFMIFGAIGTKFFPELKNGLGLPGLLFMYAGMCLFNFTWGILTIPDNRGKSLAKVEQTYENKKNSDETRDLNEVDNPDQIFFDKANSELKQWKYEQIGRGIDKRNKQIVWKYRNHSQLQIEIN